jgi:hypothetical protein
MCRVVTRAQVGQQNLSACKRVYFSHIQKFIGKTIQDISITATTHTGNLKHILHRVALKSDRRTGYETKLHTGSFTTVSLCGCK